VRACVRFCIHNVESYYYDISKKLMASNPLSLHPFTRFFVCAHAWLMYHVRYSVRDECYYTESELIDGKAPTGSEV